MESLSANDKQNMVSSFLEIAVGQTAETGRQFLQDTSWNLEEAIQLFYVGQDGAVRDTLYDDDDAMLNLYGVSSAGFLRQEPTSSMTGVWEISSASTADTSRSDHLASLYRPPFHLMFNGSFEKAKDAASVQDKWLLVNLQSTKEFTSHMLNRDTWANEAVSQTVSTNFIFWQVYDDTSEGKKVCTFYKLDSIPVVLVIDPITGQKMRSCCGMAVQPENLLEDLVPFMDCSPRDHLAALSHKRTRRNSSTPEDQNTSGSGVTPGDHKQQVTQKPTYPPLPEEPKGDRNLLCRVGVRLPDGRKTQRNFLPCDPIQLLWSFCYSQLEGDDTKPFRLTHAFPSKSLDYDSKLTFEESGLSNSIIYVTWE